LKNFAVFALGMVAIILVCFVALGIPVGEGFKLLAQGAAGDKFAISQTLVRATPLLITGIGIAVAWKAGAYNIGGEGQLLMGALGGATVGKFILNANLGILGSILILLASVLAGAVWSGFAGWLYQRRGVDLVISTILLNFIADKILLFCVDGFLRKAGQTSPLTDTLPSAYMLWKPSRQTDLHLGVLIALVVAVVVWFWLTRTQGGYLTRLAGANPRMARANRLDADAIKLRAMLLSGAICGLAGGIQYIGINGQLTNSFSQQFGFLAIPVALLGGLNPLAIIPSALFFGGLFAATSNLARFGGIGNAFVYIIQGLVVFGLILTRWNSERKPLTILDADPAEATSS
jgi:general nucleoside transport system permease protein